MSDHATFIANDFFDNRITSVLDSKTKHAIEFKLLEHIVNHSITSTGRSVLSHSLNNPSLYLKEINEKQEALTELRSNDKLRQGVVNLLERIKPLEEDAFYFLDIFTSWSSSDYEKSPAARKIVAEMPNWAKEIPEPESAYLKRLKNDIVSLHDSPVNKLAKGPIFRKLFKRDVVGLGELGKNHWVISPLPYYASEIKFGQMFGSMGVGAILPYIGYSVADKSSMTEHEQAVALGNIILMCMATGGIGGLIGRAIGKLRDVSNFHSPMRDRLLNEPQEAYKAIGAFDELISFDAFGREMKFSSLPIMTDEEEDYFEAKSFINPIQYKGVPTRVNPIPDYVPNDIVLGNESTITFLTGPNSGGKTSASKAIVQARILAQAGCYIPAEYGKMNIAHRMHYQVGSNDSQGDEEGGLGTQFLQTKDVLFNGNRRTFAVVDDLIEGTTPQEKLRHTRDQLYGVIHKGINMVYVTHHFELAQEFQNKGVGDFVQVEFDGENPTHRLIPGISTNSRSDVVAKRTGFDKDAITDHLVENGYLKSGQPLDDISAFARH